MLPAHSLQASSPKFNVYLTAPLPSKCCITELTLQMQEYLIYVQGVHEQHT